MTVQCKESFFFHFLERNLQCRILQYCFSSKSRVFTKPFSHGISIKGIYLIFHYGMLIQLFHMLDRLIDPSETTHGGRGIPKAGVKLSPRSSPTCKRIKIASKVGVDQGAPQTFSGWEEHSVLRWPRATTIFHRSGYFFCLMLQALGCLIEVFSLTLLVRELVTKDINSPSPSRHYISCI